MSSSKMRRYTVEDIGRVYEHPDRDLWLPSVSTVLDVRPKPKALVRWLERTDNADEINRFKRNRGTLIHYDLLNPLALRAAPDDVADKDADLWSDDEQGSVDELKSERKFAECCRDRDWATDVAWPHIQRVTNMDYIIDVETFVINVDVGYAGQFDLLYYDAVRDEVVLSDIKTGKSVYDKNQLQGTAYKQAVPIVVDRVEIIRINPDFKDWTLSYDRDWGGTHDERWNEFKDLHEQLAVDEMVDSIRTQAEDGTAFVEGENE